MHDDIDSTSVGSDHPSPTEPTAVHLQHGANGGQTSVETHTPVNTPADCGAPGPDLQTPEPFTLVELNQKQIDYIVQSVPGGATNVQDIYPLTPLQEGILFHRLLNERNDSYVLSTLFALPSRAEVGALFNSIQLIINRHDILRSAVLWRDLPRPIQVVHRQAILPIRELKLDPNLDLIEQLGTQLRPGAVELDPSRAPIGQLEVVSLPDGKCYALLRFHHIVCDHDSLRLLIAEALMCLQGRAHQLPPPAPYRSHVASALNRADHEDLENFFRSKLEGITEPTAPFGLTDVYGDGTQIEECRQIIDAMAARELRSRAQRAGVTMARLFHAAWALVVAHTTGRDDVVYGTVLREGSRRDPNARPIIGMAVNTLPLRLQIKHLNARELIDITHRELLDLLSVAHAPLTLAQRCSGISSKAPLFTTTLNYRRGASAPIVWHEHSSAVRVVARGEAWSNYPIGLTVEDTGEQFILIAQTHRRVDPGRMVGYLDTAVRSLIDALERAPATPALALTILPESERQQILVHFNETEAPQPQGCVVQDLVRQHFERAPDTTAVTYAEQSLTYAELDGKSNQLARHLIAKGIVPDSLVGLCIERSLNLIVALLGVLKAGGAYLPLDPHYPTNRLAYMLADASPKVVLTQNHLRSRLPDTDANVIAVDTDWPDIAAQSSAQLDARAIGLTPNHLAYVIYTSGSTGEPKGVLLEHKGLCNLAMMQTRAFEIGPDSRILQFASLSFDACTWECVMALCSGACLCLADREQLIPGEPLQATLKNHRITHATLPPIAVGALSESHRLNDLKTLIVAGESCPATLVERWGRDRQFVNAYGPTETTVCATMQVCDPSDPGNPPIGRPIRNTQIYVLNSQLQPVPIGVTGELYIGGTSLARGYLNRAEMTDSKFLPNPFNADPDARMYKTGDLGRWRSDGTIDYLGRNDHQVKIRGFRIELGEIEAQLSRNSQVKEAIVLAREDTAGDKRLVAYIVPTASNRRGPALSVETLRTQMKTVLPDHMVPAAFIILERFPLTLNGKLDTRALPEPGLGAYVIRQYEPPQGEIEGSVASIWQELLSLDRVGRQDNFFDLGGHSLSAMQMTARIRSVLGLEIPISTVFKLPTLHQLATQLDNLNQERSAPRSTVGDREVDELLNKVASMPEHKVQELLHALTAKERP